MSWPAYGLLAIVFALALFPWYVAFTATTELPGRAMLLGAAALYTSYVWFQQL
tara:strand:+ start:697 stop:855 length:159 start_codon:yes stop_codon:yes gene_type:complete